MITRSLFSGLRYHGDVIRVFVFFLSAFWLTNCGFDTSEGIYHYQVAKHIIATGQLGFDHPVEGIFLPAPNGWTYGSHEFGNTLLLIPTAAVNQGLRTLLTWKGMAPDRVERLEQFAVSFQAGIYAALTITLVYLILTREYGQTIRAGFLACMALGFGTYFWNYSRTLYDGVLCDLLLVAALWFLLRYRATGSLTRVGIAFCLLGFAVDTRLSMVVPVVAAIGFVIAVCPRSRWGALGVAAAALAPFAAWQMWYNHLRTGNFLVSPVQTAPYAGANALDGDLVTGLIGLLISPGKGLLVYAPLLVLSVAAFSRFWRRDRVVAGFVLATGVLWLLLHAKLRSWYGAWGWGPRHQITILSLIALPGLINLPELWARVWGRTIIAAVVLAGFVLAAAAIIGNYHYRMELALAEGRLGDETFIWGWQCQPVDMLIGAGRNLEVVAGLAAPLTISEASDLNNYASNRINVWWFTLPHAGVSPPVIAIAVVPLVVGLIWSGRGLLRRPR